MARGRPSLTQRIKLNNKLVRLQKEIEEIRTKLAGRLEDDMPAKVEEKTEPKTEA